MRHPEIFSADVGVGLIGNQRPLIPLHLDPPEQTRYRKLLDPLFMNREMKKLAPAIREVSYLPLVFPAGST